MKKCLEICLCAVLLCAGCSGINLPETDQQVVVEGWAEDGGRPVVIVTTSVPVSEDYMGEEELKEHIVRWAKVSINDGEKETVLSGRIDRNYFPAYIYSKDTYLIQAGKSYSITVEYSGRKVRSSFVKVPQRRPLEYLRVERIAGESDSFRIVGGLKDDPQTRDRYKFFVKREKKDSSYLSSFLGYIDDQSLDDQVEEIAIHNGIGISSYPLNQYFSSEDVVYVKFSVLDDETWKYWSDFEELTSLSSNPFFPVTSSIRSNVEGGLGYWSGFGSTYYKVSIPDSLAQGRVY